MNMALYLYVLQHNLWTYHCIYTFYKQHINVFTLYKFVDKNIYTEDALQYIDFIKAMEARNVDISYIIIYNKFVLGVLKDKACIFVFYMPLK